MYFEVKIIEFLQSFSTPFLDVLFSMMSYIFDYPIVIAGFLMFWFLKSRHFAIFYVGAQGVGAVAQKILKAIIQRPRPMVDNSTIRSIFPTEVDGFSLPSGHSVAAMGFAFFLVLYVFCVSKNNKNKTITLITAVLFLLLNLLNRLYLGQHYLTDVFAGYVLMFALCFVSYFLYKPFVNISNKMINKIKEKFRKENVKEEETNIG